MNRIDKHRKLSGIIRCPNCRSALRHENVVALCGVPFWSDIFCDACGPVGVTANGRVIFEAFDASPARSVAVFSGALKQIEVTLDEGVFSPKDAWRKDEFVWSEHPGASFRIETRAIALGLTLLKHPWSGIAEIRIDGKSVDTLDLYEETGSVRRWLPYWLPRGGVFEVVVTGRKNPRSRGCQVHIPALEAVTASPMCTPGFYYPPRNRGNPYPPCLDTLLAQMPRDGLALDCGSGDRSHPDPRLIGFEYSRFEGPDVFGDGHNLPFTDEVFDFVLSQAVIEHLCDPFRAVDEIYRVLKPGGVVYVESAFMQPLHAVPYHFFNTTGWGLERLFHNFVERKITHEGALEATLDWIYRTTALRQKGFGDEIDALLRIAKELDRHIVPEELKNFSSYVTLLARKPS